MLMDHQVFEEHVGKPVDYGIFAEGLVIAPVLLHPQSRGEVTLVSKDPMRHPIIDYDAFKDERDISRLTLTMRIIEEHLNAPSMKKLNAQILYHDVLAREFGKGTDAYWMEYMRRFPAFCYHPVGTCRMGTSKGTSVVDSNLRVWGVEGLRVADASIMPEISSGNTNVPTGIIAMKMVEILLGQYVVG